ncbi:hypothetical protein LC612_28545 [Nostoc sp. CHAB 5834]|nr:hypothetical protein [Nostoc sp. CHAB 5834]
MKNVNTSQPSYLVELLNPKTGEIESVDICANASAAIQQVRTHLQRLFAGAVHVEVSCDAQGEIEGFGFFDDVHSLISCVTVYRIAHDEEIAQEETINEACKLSPFEMERALTSIFNS